MGLVFLLYVYLFGGITFSPIVIFAFVYFHPTADDSASDNDTDVPQDKDTPYEVLKATEIDETSKSGLGAYMAGWVTVTQEYLESTSDITATTQSISESHENKSAYSSLYKLVKNSEQSGDTIAPQTTNSDTSSIASSNDFSGSSNGNSSITRRGSSSTLEPVSTPSNPAEEKKIRSSQKKHRFYAVLRHGNLFLYKNEKKKDVKHVIVLQGNVVAIWPRGLPEGQLFTKRTCICIMKKDYSRPRRLSEGGRSSSNDFITTLDILKPQAENQSNLIPPKGSFFVYCDTNIDKEDWYFALIRATKKIADSNKEGSVNSTSSGSSTPPSIPGQNQQPQLQQQQQQQQLHKYIDSLDPSIYAKSLHFKTANMIDLIQTLYSSEGQFQTKWLNAIIGRLFLALQKTDTLKNYLLMKVEKKLMKINKPGFLDEFQIKKLDVGNSAPYFTYPSLKEISPDGTLILSTNVHYHGQLSIQIATKVFVNLGIRFKAREVDVLLSVTLIKLEGRVIIKIKPAPSERIWYSFETEPTIDLKIEPIVSSRQMNYTIITSTIEKKFKEAIKESLVLPHWDDLVFHDTEDEVYRGGIWDKSVRPQHTGDDLESILEEVIAKKAKEQDSQSIKSFDSSAIADSDIELSANTSHNGGIGFATTSGSNAAKLKLTSTLTDLTKKIKKAKSSTTMSISQENCLSDGSVISGSPVITSSETWDDSDTSKKYGMNTLKKFGKWYFKDGNQAPASESEEHHQQSMYKPPEMISNRRQPRKSVTSGDIPEQTPGGLASPAIATASTFPPPQSIPDPSLKKKSSYEMFSKFPSTVDSHISSPSIQGGNKFDPVDLAIPPQPFSSRRRVNSGSSLTKVSSNTSESGDVNEKVNHPERSKVEESELLQHEEDTSIASPLRALSHGTVKRKAPPPDSLPATPPMLPQRDTTNIPSPSVMTNLYDKPTSKFDQI